MSNCLLYATEHAINENIVIKIPTVREIMTDENSYDENISLLTATPYDMMVQLDDMGIDFTEINEWDLFLLLFEEVKNRDMSLIFPNISFSDYDLAVEKTEEEVEDKDRNIVLLNKKTGSIIDRGTYNSISRFLRRLLSLEKTNKKPANDEAKKYMIERARIRLNRKKRSKPTSRMESLIVALVNTAEFSYDYQTVLDITIYQFYASLRQIVKKINYDNLMGGYYAGTVNIGEINQEELSWISTK